MTGEQSSSDGQDIFAEHAEWLAAEARQLIRADRADDAKATEVALFYFTDYISKVLLRHLSIHEPAWDNSLRPLDFASHRWFDSFSAKPDYPVPGCVHLRGTICWAIGQTQWYYDPLEFQIEWCPATGAFKKYVFRFADSLSLSAKAEVREMTGVPVGGWAYEFERRDGWNRVSMGLRFR